MNRDPLPIDPLLPELCTALSRNGAVVLRSPTGSGKTTRVPPALVGFGHVIVLEPRRVAARAAARRMASEDRTNLGDRFGYSVRFDKRYGPRTQVVCMTPGILLRMLHDDPYLEAFGVVVFDEFHERGIESDLLLGLLKLVQSTVRPELKLVIMSATIDAAPIAKYLGRCPVLESQGRTFPVTIEYQPRASDTELSVSMADAILIAAKTRTGDVLAFVPGLREIRETIGNLETIATREGWRVFPLHGELSAEDQDRALVRYAERKIVVATNVAETSVTVDGVTIVVDSGLARQLVFDPNRGLNRLRLGPIAKDAADQRAGRAGRTQPGVGIRLWDELGHRARPDETLPEIRRADLAPAILQLMIAGETDPRAFDWFEPPRDDATDTGLSLLTQLGAIQDGNLTELGQSISRWPLHPRLGRLLEEALNLGCFPRATVLAALLSERDPFERDTVRKSHSTQSDLLDRLEAIESFARSGRLETPIGRLHRGGAHQILQAAEQLRRMAQDSTNVPDSDDALLNCIFAAYADRLARRRGRGERRALMIGGRGVRLGPNSGVDEAELFVCIDVDAGGTESLVRIASGVRREWLEGPQLATQQELEFDDSTLKVVAFKRTRYSGLVISQTQGHLSDDEQISTILLQAAKSRLESVLPAPDSAAGQLMLRAKCLKTWWPECDAPNWDADDLDAVLEQLARGKRSLADLRAGAWVDALRTSLTYAQWQLLQREVPESFVVPSGREVTIEYALGRAPILAAKIQEFFGLSDTPRLAGGRVKLLIHLLAPNGRPQQVTDDLSSFWASTYAVVRKDLRGRYPKHDWPEDPTTATASRGPKRRPPE